MKPVSASISSGVTTLPRSRLRRSRVRTKPSTSKTNAQSSLPPLPLAAAQRFHHVLSNPYDVALQQGDVDGACGPYCLLMALSLLDRTSGISWSQVMSRERGDLGVFAQKLRDYFFVGTELEEMVACIKAAPLNPPLRYVVCTAESKQLAANSASKAMATAVTPSPHRRSRVEQFCLRHVTRGAVVILGISATNARYDHWTLLTGWETVDTDPSKSLARSPTTSIRALLCLDPSCAAPNLSGFNARIELDSLEGVIASKATQSAQGFLRSTSDSVAFVSATSAASDQPVQSKLTLPSARSRRTAPREPRRRYLTLDGYESRVRLVDAIALYWPLVGSNGVAATATTQASRKSRKGTHHV